MFPHVTWGKNSKVSFFIDFNFYVILLEKCILGRKYMDGPLLGVGLSLVEGKLAHLITAPPEHIQWGRVNS